MTRATIYFDTETGGVHPEAPIIQLAAVAVDDTDGTELEGFEIKLQFDERICDPEAMATNHYDPERWADAVPPSTAVALFERFLQPYRRVRCVAKKTRRLFHVAQLCGYNASLFDGPRVRDLYGGKWMSAHLFVADTYHLIKWYLDIHELEPESTSLSAMCSYFDIPLDNAHDALDDARATARLTLRVKQLLKEGVKQCRLSV